MRRTIRLWVFAVDASSTGCGVVVEDKLTETGQNVASEIVSTRGGATSHFQRHGSYDAVAERGRGASQKVMKSYLNSAWRQKTEQSFTAKT